MKGVILFWIAMALMAYPIAELSRLCYVYYTEIQPLTRTIVELVLMWVAYLVGLVLIGYALKRGV